jgi:hypothetical protein
MRTKLTDKEQEFLLGLEELTRRTGVAITACGCCESPFLIDVSDAANPQAGYDYVDLGDLISWHTEEERGQVSNNDWQRVAWLADKETT